MHIGFYLDEWREGGVPAFIRRAMRGLAAHGDQTTLFLARPHPKHEPSAQTLFRAVREEFGPRCVSLDLPAFPERWAQRHLVTTIASAGISCLFASQFRAQTSALRQLSRHVPIVGVAHNDLDYYYHEYLGAQDFLAGQVAVSQAVFDTCRRYTPPALRDRVFIVPYGAGTVDLPVTTPAASTLEVVYCSRLDRTQKRSLDLGPIWKSFLERGGRGTLTIIGSGKALPALRSNFAAEVRSSTVRFRGHLLEEEVFRAMSAADVILNISNFEGLPQTVIEGAALGLWPLLSDTRSGHAEIVAAIGAGTICSIGDTSSFACELVALAARLDELRASRSQRAARARAVYSSTKCFAAYHAIAEEVARDFLHRTAHATHQPTLRERLHRAILLANYRRQMH